ncbi:hemophore-related protein [Mycobacteroides franklinii]|uniref:hemophore-related protein n=1 Tax=Mycobacteroides franklinii TaxID=948102 RepID=UPI0009944DCE|nr:hemophore-related protein [Mycobacteroides franklinii]
MKLPHVRIRQIALTSAVSVFAGLAAAVTAPTAFAAPDCSQERLSDTVGTTTSATRSYLDSHPGARAVFDAAPNQSRPEAAASIRTYFTAHPTEYHELLGILAPIGNAQRECNVTVLPAGLASAYDEFMAG